MLFNFSEKIFKSLEEIKSDQKHLRRQVRDLARERRLDGADERADIEIGTFPLNLEEVNNFERKLQDATFQDRVVSTR